MRTRRSDSRLGTRRAALGPLAASSSNPPTEVSHEYQRHYCPTCALEPATLTVTDSASHTDSDSQLAEHMYPD